MPTTREKAKRNRILLAKAKKDGARNSARKKHRFETKEKRAEKRVALSESLQKMYKEAINLAWAKGVDLKDAVAEIQAKQSAIIKKDKSTP
jgi:hypothetical protein